MSKIVQVSDWEADRYFFLDDNGNRLEYRKQVYYLTKRGPVTVLDMVSPEVRMMDAVRFLEGTEGIDIKAIKLTTWEDEGLNFGQRSDIGPWRVVATVYARQI